MLSRADILFGKIAVAEGMVTQEQVDECVKLQESLAERKPLGVILMEKEYLTQDHLQRIIELQRRNLERRAIHSRWKRTDSLFGKLAIRFGLATEEQVNECVRIQAKIEPDIFLRLGEILVKKGYMTNDMVQRILEFQKKRIFTCPKCSTEYNVVMYNPGTLIRCYRCNETLLVPEPGEGEETAEAPAEQQPEPPPEVWEAELPQQAKRGEQDGEA